jgi:hypothetical protein
MPFNELQRRDSWPPTILHIRESHNPSTDTYDANAIDENPFSYFLTSPEDIDDFDDEDLSAGIESSSTSKPIIREISPSSLQRVPLILEEDEEEESSFIMPLSLKDFTTKHISGRKSRTGYHKGVTGLGISLPETASTRGRARIKLASTRAAGQGRGRARTLSARRPQSWSMPSPDIFSIEEENEDEIHVEQQKTPEIVVTTPDERHIYHLAPAAFEPKQKKRVHWAI